jgi:hypothetical protein
MAFIKGCVLSADIYIDLKNRSRILHASNALKDNEAPICQGT